MDETNEIQETKIFTTKTVRANEGKWPTIQRCRRDWENDKLVGESGKENKMETFATEWRQRFQFPLIRQSLVTSLISRKSPAALRTRNHKNKKKKKPTKIHNNRRRLGRYYKAVQQTLDVDKGGRKELRITIQNNQNRRVAAQKGKKRLRLCNGQSFLSKVYKCFVCLSSWNQFQSEPSANFKMNADFFLNAIFKKKSKDNNQSLKGREDSI